MRKPSLALSIAALVAAAVVIVDAQGRGGRGGGPGGAGPAGGRGGARSGTIERITVHGKALEGNLEGDPADRDVTVYLPPSYAADQTRRFPVVYLLHGYGGRDDTFTERIANLAESANRLSASQGFSDLIVVTPNAYTLHKGSMYSSSPTIGDWERFIAEDLVAAIDARYRTFAGRMSRGIGGHSMGGYGALRIAMKRPDVFSSLYVMSACCLDANRSQPVEQMAAAEAIRTREQAEEASRAPGLGPSATLATAAAWSPNPANPPLFLDLPVRDGKLRPDVLARWAANAPLETIDTHAEALRSLYAIAVDIGVKDPMVESTRQLHRTMMRLRIPHLYEEYDGDHTDRVRERLERNVLLFFSQQLASPANPSSPPMQR
jgi:S-formylglutathione hydrolase FrmB